MYNTVCLTKLISRQDRETEKHTRKGRRRQGTQGVKIKHKEHLDHNGCLIKKDTKRVMSAHHSKQAEQEYCDGGADTGKERVQIRTLAKYDDTGKNGDNNEKKQTHTR